MENDRSSAPHSLIGGSDQPLTGVVVEEGGRRLVRYSTDDPASASGPLAKERLQAALAVIGAWGDLDWDEFSQCLDRIRHESPPTPPIEV